MLSSIHPLGERSRQNRWIVTAGAFSLGSGLAGAAVGLVLGWVGSLGLASLTVEASIVTLGVVVAAAAVLDALKVSPPGPERQVNESWIGAFRGWVYGGAFGIQLGTGFATYIVTWGVYATFASYLLIADPALGALIGVTFGLGRSLSVIAAGYIDRPSRLTSFNRGLAVLGPKVRVGAVASLAIFSVLSLASGVA